MRTIATLSTAALIAMTPSANRAAGDGDLWVAIAVPVCISQFADLSGLPLASAGQSVSGILGLQQKPQWQSCIERRQWLPRGLCTELLQQDPEGKLNRLQDMFDRYREEIGGMTQLLQCIDSSPAR